jgi:4-hydroxy-4-methyl-2-oxoglutarate aldolase
MSLTSAPPPQISNSVYLGIVYDAMRLLGYRTEQYYFNIKPQAGYSSLVEGPAFTTAGRVVGREENYEELDKIRYEIYTKKYFVNSPIVVLQANDQYCAHSGDITSQIYQALGAVGFVTDGNVRDKDLIDGLKFPTFCEGINPIDAIDYWSLTEYDIPVQIKGVDIHVGDYLYASSDGVIRVQQRDLPKFREKLVELLEKENSARELIESIKAQDSFTNSCEDFVETHGRW